MSPEWGRRIRSGGQTLINEVGKNIRKPQESPKMKGSASFMQQNN
jgi:hypothetical protein